MRGCGLLRQKYEKINRQRATVYLPSLKWDHDAQVVEELVADGIELFLPVKQSDEPEMRRRKVASPRQHSLFVLVRGLALFDTLRLDDRVK